MGYSPMRLSVTSFPARLAICWLCRGVYPEDAYCTVTAKYARGKNLRHAVRPVNRPDAMAEISRQRPAAMSCSSWPVVCSLRRRSPWRWGWPTRRGTLASCTATSAYWRRPPYFTPVLSSALAAILLSATCRWSFWQGAGMVCLAQLPALLVRHSPLARDRLRLPAASRR